MMANCQSLYYHQTINNKKIETFLKFNEYNIVRVYVYVNI